VRRFAKGRVGYVPDHILDGDELAEMAAGGDYYFCAIRSSNAAADSIPVLAVMRLPDPSASPKRADRWVSNREHEVTPAEFNQLLEGLDLRVLLDKNGFAHVVSGPERRKAKRVRAEYRAVVGGPREPTRRRRRGVRA
jgi:hypothetical protein